MTSPFERVLRRVRPDGDCLVFTGHCNAFGYGRVQVKRKLKQAHRVVWEHHHGATDLNVCHHCDNPPCVNIDHLFAGTQKENVHDSLRKGRHVRLFGQRNPHAKFTDEQDREMRRLRLLGLPLRAIARRFAAHHTYVGEIVRGERRQDD